MLPSRRLGAVSGGSDRGGGGGGKTKPPVHLSSSIGNCLGSTSSISRRSFLYCTHFWSFSFPLLFPPSMEGRHEDDDTVSSDGDLRQVDKNEDVASQSDDGVAGAGDVGNETLISTPSVIEGIQQNQTGETQTGTSRRVPVEGDASTAGRPRGVTVEADTDTSSEAEEEVNTNPIDDGSQEHRPYQLHEAIKSQDIGLLNELLARSPDLELPNEIGRKPLYLAAELGFLQGVAALLDAGSDVESSNSLHIGFPTALQQAVDKNFTNIAELLIQKGAQIDSRDAFGDTPLLNAVKKRFPDMIQLLLTHGADRTIEDRNGSSVAKLARGSAEISALLEKPMVLEGPPPLRHEPFQRQSRFNMSSLAPRHNRSKMVALHGFQATVVDFFVGDGFERRIEKSLSVFELLYGRQRVMEIPQTEILKGKRRSFRWYHLPANNVRTLSCSAMISLYYNQC